jgi:uncharacterized protein YjbI with pentapeptide repeats
MNYPHDRIPEEKTQEVFTLAATLYAKHNQSYSVKELMEAGAEAKIPPEFIQQAVEQIQLEHQRQSLSNSPSKPYLAALVIGIPVLTALAVVGLIARNAMLHAQEKQVPFVAAQPVAQPPLNETTLPVGNFKCANLDLAGQDLRDKNLQGADCTNAKLGNANLSGVNLEGANLSKSDLSNAKLNGASFKGTNLANANLKGADLTNANLEGANLSNTDLSNANIKGANLNGADLAKAKTDDLKK